MEDPIAEMEENTTVKNLEEKVMIEILKTSKESHNVSAEYAQRLHTQTYLDAQSSRSIFQANQDDQVASLRKIAQIALEQCSETVFIMVWRTIKIISARLKKYPLSFASV